MALSTCSAFQSLEFTWPAGWGTSGRYKIISDRTFVFNGKVYPVGRISDPIDQNWCALGTISISSGIPTFSSFTLPQTDVGITDINSSGEPRLTLIIYSNGGKTRRNFLFQNWRIGQSLTTSFSFEDLAIYNTATQPANPRPYYLDADAVNNLITSRLNAPATTTQLGIGEVDAAPADSAHPVFVGSNSPVVGRNSDDYASLNAAVTAIGSTPTTLTITNAFPSGATTVVPSTLRLKFVSGGSIVLGSGHTVTIKSDAKEWPVAQIFSGSGVVRFTNNHLLKEFYPQWWGVVGDTVATYDAATISSGTDDTVALQACIDATPNQSSIIFTSNLRMKITSTINVFLRDGLTFKGMGYGGYHSYVDSGLPYFIWAGSSGGMLMDVNKTAGSLFQNLGFSNRNGVALNIDHTTSGSTSTSTGIAVKDCYFRGGLSGFVGIRFAYTSTVLVDNMFVSGCNFVGAASPTGTGIQVGGNGGGDNAFAHTYARNWFDHLSYGVKANSGGNYMISDSLTTNNDVDFYLNASSPSVIEGTQSEFAKQFLINAGQQVTVRGSRFGGPASGVGVKFISTPGALSKLIFENNYFDLTAALEVFDGGSGTLKSSNNRYPNGDITLLGFTAFNEAIGDGSDTITNGGSPVGSFDLQSPFAFRRAYKGLTFSGVSRQLIGLEGRGGQPPGYDANSKVSIDEGALGTILGGGLKITGDDLQVGTVAFRKFYKTQSSLDFGSIAAHTTAELTITVTGVAVGDSVVLSPNTSPMFEAGLIPFAFVSAPNTVTVRMLNGTAGAIDPAAFNWRVLVFAY
jgi:hypothetical protein